MSDPRREGPLNPAPQPAGIAAKRANHTDMTTPGAGDRSDRDLVLAFQAGDRAAYDELYRRHHERVARLCFRFLHNRPDAEEAAQETFLKAFQALPRFNGQYQVGAWLSRIAANVCVDNLRVKSRSHLVALPSEDRHVVTERGPEEILAGDDPRIDIAIKDIQPLHAHALRMRGMEGMSHVEIAGLLQMTPAQVKALLHRARSSFKKAWDKAQGWLVAPVIGTRSLDRSSSVSASSNLAFLSAHAPAIAEKAAASALIVFVALAGSPPAPSTPSNIGVSVAEAAPDAKEKVRPARVVAIEAPVADVPTGNTAKSEDPALTDDLIAALPETLSSTIEGGKDVDTPDDGDDDGSGGGAHIVPPTIKESPKKVRDTVVDTLHSLNGSTE